MSTAARVCDPSTREAEVSVLSSKAGCGIQHMVCVPEKETGANPGVPRDHSHWKSPPLESSQLHSPSNPRAAGGYKEPLSPASVVAHTCNSSTWEAESGKSQVQGQPRLHSKNDQKNKQKNKQIIHRVGHIAYYREAVVRFENDLGRPSLSLRSLSTDPGAFQ